MKRVVVTGMGVISPVGCEMDTFWNSLKNGVSGIGLIESFDTTDFKVKVAAEIKDFDPLQYMDKMTAKSNDRFVQFAIAAAAQAMADSNIQDQIEPERLGVYFGSGVGGFASFADEQSNYIKRGPSRVSPKFITRIIANMAAGNIAIFHHAKGPCLDITTACASGTSSIGEAYRAIAGGYADAIITGGVDATITPLSIAGFTNNMALTTCDNPEEACVPFDKRRSGFVMGEGAGALILEEYEHAVARGAKIYAEVAGYGSTCDAHHVTAPEETAESPARAIKDSCKEYLSSVPAEHIYFNAHGTSTHLNDLTETNALKKVFGADAYKLHISSTKSMTGHMLGAAGAVEAIASIMALKENLVPPTIHFEERDPECDLDYTPNTALSTTIDLAISSSLGFGGHNACVAFKRV